MGKLSHSLPCPDPVLPSSAAVQLSNGMSCGIRRYRELPQVLGGQILHQQHISMSFHSIIDWFESEGGSNPLPQAGITSTRPGGILLLQTRWFHAINNLLSKEIPSLPMPIDNGGGEEGNFCLS